MIDYNTVGLLLFPFPVQAFDKAQVSIYLAEDYLKHLPVIAEKLDEKLAVRTCTRFYSVLLANSNPCHCEMLSAGSLYMSRGAENN